MMVKKLITVFFSMAIHFPRVRSHHVRTGHTRKHRL